MTGMLIFLTSEGCHTLYQQERKDTNKAPCMQQRLSYTVTTEGTLLILLCKYAKNPNLE